MRLCPKCQNPIKVRVKIDGVLHILSSRKYCLDCSPFGQHNTRRIHEAHYRVISDEKICSKCKKLFKRKGTVCGNCIVAKSRLKRKQRAIEYKGGSCQRCGYNRCIGALTFHHRDPTIKEFGLSTGWNQSWDRTKRELDKCDLLCTNCHAEEHWKGV